MRWEGKLIKLTLSLLLLGAAILIVFKFVTKPKVNLDDPNRPVLHAD